MSTTIQLRGDTAANWTAVNPVLHSREVGIEIDTSKAKFGDGVTAWNALAYWNPAGADTDPFLPLTGGTLSGPLIAASITAGPIIPLVSALTDAATVLVNAALANDFRLLFTTAIGASRNIGNPSNPSDGQTIEFGLTQPASGGPCTVVWGSAYDFASGSAPTLSTVASKLDVVGFKYYASISKWVVLGSSLGA